MDTASSFVPIEYLQQLTEGELDIVKNVVQQVLSGELSREAVLEVCMELHGHGEVVLHNAQREELC